MFSKSTIKYIQSLRHKKFRDEYNVFVAEGPKVVTEFLQAGIFTCKALYAVEGWLESLDPTIAQTIEKHVEIIAGFELEKIAHYSTANKVVAIFEKRNLPKSFTVKNKLTLVLDDIQDPGNLGTIIRTADWFGIENIVCSENTVDMYNSKVVQSTMASLGNVQIHYTDLSGWLKNSANVQIFAATLQGKPLKNYQKTTEAIIIIGNESKGISDEILLFANEKITIPKSGFAESLNAAVATAIILYALKY